MYRDETPSVIETQELHKQNAAKYQFQSLWEPVDMTEKQKQQVANYQFHLNVPYRREDNYLPDTKISRKKLIITNNDPRHTIDPWMHGSIPFEQQTKKTFKQPETILWNNYDKKDIIYPFPSCGDPIMDQLRAKLLNEQENHQENSLLTLSKKFKLFDTDDNKTLDIHEFKKVLKEYQFSEKSIEHLFRFIDKDDTGSITLDEFLYSLRVSVYIITSSSSSSSILICIYHHI